MYKQISKLISQEYLYFYDALSPIVSADSIDYDKVFFASRYETTSHGLVNLNLIQNEKPLYEEDVNKNMD